MILLRWPIHGWLHRRCLRRIALLERELGIGRVVGQDGVVWIRGDEVKYEIKPGAVWPVVDPTAVRMTKVDWLDDGSKVTTLVAQQAHDAVKHKMAIAGLFYSGEAARAARGSVPVQHVTIQDGAYSPVLHSDQ